MAELVDNPAANSVGNVGTTRNFHVSVVVFYKRDLDVSATAPSNPPAERMLLADLVGGGFAGGDVILRLGSSGASNWLNVSVDQWVMLTGRLAGSFHAVAQWYRVRAVNESPVPDQRLVTLDGPDWDPLRFVDADGDATYPTAFVTIVNGAFGVFEKTIKLDGTSLWSD
jgi:hypothetical protein